MTDDLVFGYVMPPSKEWSLKWHNWSIGIFRNTLGGYELVYRRPYEGGCLNTFIPLWGCCEL